MNENTTVALGKVQMTPKGEYSPETAYDFLDVVSYEGGSYLAKKPSQNIPVTNETYWICLAEKGNTGAAAGFGTPTIEVSELDPDSEPTAEVTATGEDTEKVFHFAFGIPQGQQGDTGNGIESIEKTDTEGNVDTYTITYTDGTTTTFDVTNGVDGAAAGFGTPTATIDDEVGTPYIEVTATGPDTEKVFSFAFHNMKGNTGAAAGFGTPTATIDNETGTPSVDITATGEDTEKVFNFEFHNIKGIPGVSPEVTIEEITGGHKVTITDAEHPEGQEFNVLDGAEKPYLSMERKSRYLYDITFKTEPTETDVDSVPGACSCYVSNGKLYRNLDFNYNRNATFHVVLPGIEGTAFINGLTDESLQDEIISQLPYHMVDGINENGIMVSCHIIYDDWNKEWTGDIPLTKLPYLVLKNTKSMATIETDLAEILDNIKVPVLMKTAEYLLQILVTDGTTTYVLAPDTSSGTYIIIDATSNPKLTNFRWVSDKTVVREELQERPTGVERWNMMPCSLEDLRFTAAYESPTRLSEFIGIEGTTKESTDEELTEIYNTAREEYLIRTRDGKTWQTMCSVVYSSNGIDHLWIQEDWEKDYYGGNADLEAEIARATAAEAEITEQLNTQSAQIAALESTKADKTYVDEHIKHILTKDNYLEVMREWFAANGGGELDDLTELCERWYDITRTGWAGGSAFAQYTESSLSTGTKTGDNAGLVAEPSTNITAGRDDYAWIPLFVPLDCHAYLDGDGKLHVTAIDGVCGSFDRHDTTKITAVIQMTPWIKFSQTETEFSWGYTDRKDLPGYRPYPDAVEIDGHVRNFVCHTKYAMDDSYGSASGQKVRTWDVSHNSIRTAIKTARGSRYCGLATSDLMWYKLMFIIKYASITGDNIMAGCFSYYNHPHVAVAETNVERVVVPKSTAYVVGSTVCVGGDYGGKATQIAVVDRAVITSIETETIGGTEYTVLNLNNGGVKFDTSTDNFITTMPWRTGATDSVLGNDGSPISNSSVKEPYKIQGIELMVGCYEVMGDTILKYVQDGDIVVEKPFVCRDVTKNSTSPTSDYIESSFGFPCQETASWNYIARNNYDDSILPELLWPDTKGGSSTTLTRDQYYVETASALGGLREALLFCGLSFGLANGGGSAVSGNSGLGSTYWNIGSRVSLNGNRGEYEA